MELNVHSSQQFRPMTCNPSLFEQAGCTHNDDALASGRMTNLKARAIRCKSEQEVATKDSN